MHRWQLRNVHTRLAAHLVAVRGRHTHAPHPFCYLQQIVQIEWPNPATFWSMELAQDMTTGALSVVNIKAINTASINGTVVLCAGDHTPWNTHLGGEEWDPDGGPLASCLLVVGLLQNARIYIEHWTAVVLRYPMHTCCMTAAHLYIHASSRACSSCL